MVIASAAKSDVGQVREKNEDSFLINAELGLYVVADGMGGHLGGQMASQLAVSGIEASLRASQPGAAAAEPTVGGAAAALAAQAASPVSRDARADAPATAADGAATAVPGGAGAGDEVGLASGGDAAAPGEVAALPPGAAGEPVPGGAAAARRLAEAVRAACGAIYDRAQADQALAGMGTTVTAVLVFGPWAVVAHVGDSRCYLRRGNQLTQITDDHSLVNEQMKAGLLSRDQARSSRLKNIITRSVGFERDVAVDTIALGLLPGDCLLLCSDGLINMVEDEEIAACLASVELQAAPARLVEMANARGGDDNITVICLQVGAEAEAPPGEPLR